MKLITQENGGGWRMVKLNDDDDYKNVYEKIIDIYFPSRFLF